MTPVQRDAGEPRSLTIMNPKKKDSLISKFLSPLDVEFYANYFLFNYFSISETDVSKNIHLVAKLTNRCSKKYKSDWILSAIILYNIKNKYLKNKKFFQYLLPFLI